MTRGLMWFICIGGLCGPYDYGAYVVHMNRGLMWFI